MHICRNLFTLSALTLHYNGETMTQHARKPAAAALLLTLALGLAALGATGRLAAEKPTSDLHALEKQIAGHPDAATWNAYGDALRAAGRSTTAAEAYRRALATNSVEQQFLESRIAAFAIV